MDGLAGPRIAVVIPCYRVKDQILGVLARIGPEAAAIYVVDDACPEKTGDFVEREVRDARVRVIRREHNGGVGAATLTGMSAAAEAGADILVKIDGDGQMDPSHIAGFVAPISDGRADYTKGNRFYSPEFLQGMPRIRIFGNGVLSLMNKLSSGYWTVFDPTNGFVAIHAAVFSALPREKLASRYFFESDLLFRLNLLRASVLDIPLRATYGDETQQFAGRKGDRAVYLVSSAQFREARDLFLFHSRFFDCLALPHVRDSPCSCSESSSAPMNGSLTPAWESWRPQAR